MQYLLQVCFSFHWFLLIVFVCYKSGPQSVIYSVSPYHLLRRRANTPNISIETHYDGQCMSSTQLITLKITCCYTLPLTLLKSFSKNLPLHSVSLFGKPYVGPPILPSIHPFINCSVYNQTFDFFLFWRKKNRQDQIFFNFLKILFSSNPLGYLHRAA